MAGYNYMNRGYADVPNDYKRNDGFTEPTIASRDGWEKLGPKGWTTQPSRDSPLSGPKNDIGNAVEILEEAVKNSSITAAPIQPRFAADTIDSKEAARRYSGTINSTEAASRYSGTIINEAEGRKKAFRFSHYF